jgi:hypothetical protein
VDINEPFPSVRTPGLINCITSLKEAKPSNATITVTGILTVIFKPNFAFVNVP